jgi:hypothetical protein
MQCVGEGIQTNMESCKLHTSMHPRSESMILKAYRPASSNYVETNEKVPLEAGETWLNQVQLCPDHCPGCLARRRWLARHVNHTIDDKLYKGIGQAVDVYIHNDLSINSDCVTGTMPS